MPTLVSDIMADVITELSMVTGVSTQIYAAPRIQQHVQDATIMLMDDMWWPQLMQWYSVTPDGITGRITSDLASSLLNHKVTRFQDLEAVYPYTTNKRVTIIPPGQNPFILSGTATAYITPDATYPLRPFSVWPLTAAETLAVHARAYPVLPLSTTDTVYLDRLLVTYMASYMYAEDDGTNPGQIAKFKAMFEKRLQQVTASWQQQSIRLDPRFPLANDQWSER